jgi:ribosomal protein L40E
MGELGYGTREPLVGKLKELANDIQGLYEEFLDAEALYQQGKLSDKEFFKKMGSFLKAFSSLGFLTVKVVIEINKAVGGEGAKRPEEGTLPSPTFRPGMVGGVSMPQYTPSMPAGEEAVPKEAVGMKACSKCGAQIPARAKFCTKCGAKQ